MFLGVLSKVGHFFTELLSILIFWLNGIEVLLPSSHLAFSLFHLNSIFDLLFHNCNVNFFSIKFCCKRHFNTSHFHHWRNSCYLFAEKKYVFIMNEQKTAQRNARISMSIECCRHFCFNSKKYKISAGFCANGKEKCSLSFPEEKARNFYWFKMNKSDFVSGVIPRR